MLVEELGHASWMECGTHLMIQKKHPTCHVYRSCEQSKKVPFLKNRGKRSVFPPDSRAVAWVSDDEEGNIMEVMDVIALSLME